MYYKEISVISKLYKAEWMQFSIQPFLLGVLPNFTEPEVYDTGQIMYFPRFAGFRGTQPAPLLHFVPQPAFGGPFQSGVGFCAQSTIQVFYPTQYIASIELNFTLKTILSLNLITLCFLPVDNFWKTFQF